MSSIDVFMKTYYVYILYIKTNNNICQNMLLMPARLYEYVNDTGFNVIMDNKLFLKENNRINGHILIKMKMYHPAGDFDVSNKINVNRTA